MKPPTSGHLIPRARQHQAFYPGGRLHPPDNSLWTNRRIRAGSPRLYTPRRTARGGMRGRQPVTLARMAAA